jgi:hypothetical protein
MKELNLNYEKACKSAATFAGKYMRLPPGLFNVDPKTGQPNEGREKAMKLVGGK